MERRWTIFQQLEMKSQGDWMKKKIDREKCVECLIDFDNTINFSNEPETSHKTNGSGH